MHLYEDISRAVDMSNIDLMEVEYRDMIPETTREMFFIEPEFPVGIPGSRLPGQTVDRDFVSYVTLVRQRNGMEMKIANFPVTGKTEEEVKEKLAGYTQMGTLQDSSPIKEV